MRISRGSGRIRIGNINKNQEGINDMVKPLERMQMHLDNVKKLDPKNERDKDHIWQSLRKIQIIAEDLLLGLKLK